MYKFMDNGKDEPTPDAPVVTNGNGSGPGSGDLISMSNIWKTYQMGVEQLHALRDVSFQVNKGEYLAIIGPSGSGN